MFYLLHPKLEFRSSLLDLRSYTQHGSRPDKWAGGRPKPITYRMTKECYPRWNNTYISLLTPAQVMKYLGCCWRVPLRLRLVENSQYERT